MNLLELYDEIIGEFLKNGREYTIKLKLDKKFLKTCRARIIAGHAQYGDDWQTKDNLKERKAEEYDHFNYLILHLCQSEWKKQKKWKDRSNYE